MSRRFTLSRRKLALAVLTTCIFALTVVRYELYYDNPRTGALIDIQLSPDIGVRQVNPHPYRFTRSHQDKCEHGGRDVSLVIIVHTAPNHVTRRRAIRATWGNESNYVTGVVVRTLFALGTTDNQTLQKQLEKEDTVYDDIIQETFTDSYKNLTLKTVMTLKWFLVFCQKADYLMKTDDDTYVNVGNLVRRLRKFAGKPRVVLGFIHKGLAPVRDVDNKFYLSPYEYPWESFPPIPSGGAGYVMSSDVIPYLHQTSSATKFLYLEDVFVGICLKKVGIVPIHGDGFHCCGIDDTTDPCELKRIITTHPVNASETYNIWRRTQSPDTKCGLFNSWNLPAFNWY